MPDFDGSDCFEKYLALRKRAPAAFENPSGSIYEILIDPTQIALAQQRARDVRSRNGMSIVDLRVGLLADDPYVRVMREAVRFPDGSLGLYNRVMVIPGVAVLPVMNGHIAVMRRFRHGTRTWHFEIPRGCVDGDSNFTADAERELFEEIGARPKHMTGLGMLHSSTGCLNETYHLFLADIDGIGDLETHEAITEVRLLQKSEMEAMIVDGRITDGPTLVAFLRAKLAGLV